MKRAQQRESLLQARGEARVFRAKDFRADAHEAIRTQGAHFRVNRLNRAVDLLGALAQTAGGFAQLMQFGVNFSRRHRRFPPRLKGIL
ncbi:MAG: hypothetical protein IPK17_29480 [Chloroflexi bacterium]|uniref:hypothetical protein n=1 Tax=Candidatus Flexifilum breve TaxID=3140694 RepID=UPI0031361844|nr:hypothetical protein [Chloroflexota bacterium]